jgi:sec-independent protein translocase protein TatB
MFDIGWSELLVIAIVAIVVVGPKDLPRLMRTFGHYMGKVRGMALDFQRQFEEAVRDSELDEVRKAMRDVRATATSATAAMDQPLMTPKPKAGTEALEPPAPPAVADAANKLAPKPRAKRAAAKPKAPPAETSAAPKTAKTATPKSRKPRQPKEPPP